MPSQVFFCSFSFFRAFAVVLVLVLPASAGDAVDRLGVPGPISFDGTDYALAWSSNPLPGYFKQEYVPAGQTVERYASMVLVEAAAGVDLKTALSTQVNMLNQRRGSDPLVNMDVIRNEATGEVILDFIVSDKDPQGGYIAEWSAYRYAPHPGGVLVFAISHRAYGDDEVRTFLTNLKSVRPGKINRIAQYALPEVTLPQ